MLSYSTLMTTAATRGHYCSTMLKTQLSILTSGGIWCLGHVTRQPQSPFHSCNGLHTLDYDDKIVDQWVNDLGGGGECDDVMLETSRMVHPGAWNEH